jgi:hypothetical protein
MIRKHFRKRLALGLAFAAVVAAIVVPTAQAHVYLPSATVQSHQQPTILTPGMTAAGAALANQKHDAYPVPVSSREGAPGMTAAGAALANQKHDAYPVPVSSTEAASSTGFNWSDAGIGASVTFGALLLLFTALVLGRRQRSRGLASV